MDIKEIVIEDYEFFHEGRIYKVRGLVDGHPFVSKQIIFNGPRGPVDIDNTVLKLGQKKKTD